MFQLVRKDFGEGIVCAVNKKSIFVAPLPQGVESAPTKKSCGSGKPNRCGSCGGCASLIPVHKNGYVGKFYISVDNPANFNPGDRVRFNRFIMEPNMASVLAFGIPVIFAMAAAIYYRPTFLATLGGLFCGFVILAAVDSILKKQYPSSVIAEKEGL